jgi:hypothetical protein
MKAWLRETHGPVFELFRHFLRRFFDSDLITATEHTPTALVGAVSVLMQWMFIYIQPLKLKYEHFSKLPVAGPYRAAVRADELWLITLVMAAIGLLTAIKWQSLFPGLRDYRALASLPIRPWQMFASKLLALLAVSAAAAIIVNALPSLTFPALCAGRWAIQPALGGRVFAHFAASAAASLFFLFGLVALEGVLLNLLRPRLFGRVTGSLQGVLVAAMLMLLVLSFSIQPRIADAAIQPRLARWLPPVWFLGLYQRLSGDPDPAMGILAHRALMALAAAIALTLAAYAMSYGRHRALLVEGIAPGGKNRRWAAAALDWLVPEPRQQAVVSFIVKTLANSGQHRTILMAYGGFGLAILVTAMLTVPKLYQPARVPAACFVYAHVILLVFLLIGLRHLFSLPTELAANWTFRITERDGRRHWMRAVDRLVLFAGATAMLAIPFPAEVRLLGWRALPEAVLFALFGLLCYEWAFSSWEKLPFTCSYLPGRTPAWILALKFLGLLAVLPAVSGILIACLYNWLAFLAVLAVLLVAWNRARDVRKETWGEIRLKYEESPEPTIQGLGLIQ